LYNLFRKQIPFPASGPGPILIELANKISEDRPLPDLKDSLNLGLRNFNFPIFISSFFIFLFICYNTASAYTPPIGIPDPGYWGSIHPIDSEAPGTATTCPNWPSSLAANCYYVDNSVPCSNSGNGYPDFPRCSIHPLLSSGAFVEVHGGP